MNKTQYKLFIKYVLLNDGATLNHSGALVSFNNGYTISTKKHNLKIKNIKMLSLKTLNKLLNIAKSTGLYVGVWYNRAGRYYDIDLNIIAQDITTATIKARANCQRAIFDNKNLSSIYINY